MKKSYFNLFKIVLVLSILPSILITVQARETFGDPSNQPLPNITNIKIHDVTGLSQDLKETGGSLVSEGLNRTFSLNQSVKERTYRFTFVLNNTGSQTWLINESDTLYHESLNSSWSVESIWYNLSQQNTGGTFSGGKVSWNTSNQGTLEPHEIMYAKYLVNISAKSSITYQQTFKVNDSVEESGSIDQHDLEVNKIGYLNITLLEPPNDTIVKKDQLFTVNASVRCANGVCGNVTSSARYNETSSADTLISENSGTPFYTNKSNEKVCDQELLEGESCYVSWDVNATGNLESYHLIDVNSSSSFSEISENDSEDHLVQINLLVLMDLNFSVVDFGYLTPGDQNKSAKGNSNLTYNITVSDNSVNVDNLYIKSSPLVSQENENYSIGPENLSVDLDQQSGGEMSLSENFQNLISDVSPGSIINTFYYIDIPYGLVTGEYLGTMTFKANSTI